MTISEVLSGKKQQVSAIGGAAEAVYLGKLSLSELPSSRLPEEPSPPSVVYQAITDIRQFDGNPRLNLASFVSTWMEPEAKQLINDSLNVNFIDMQTYASSKEIEDRCIAMLSDLYHAPKNDGRCCGTATIGSTEACLLGALNMKKRWVERRRAKGLPADKPNIVMGANFQVCWEKFCKYFDVEPRLVHVTEGCYHMTPDKLAPIIDENTIGVVAILGSTYTGEFDDVAGFDKVVEAINKEKGWEVPIHVDAASGGFVVPFMFPDMVWDFRLKNVLSISVSGHKFGLVFPGIGWNIWRSRDMVHQDLIFNISYLGAPQENLTMNFSRPACFIIAQYYQFLRLGRKGYTLVNQNMQQVAKHLADGIAKMGHFQVMNDPLKTVPLVCFRLKTNDERQQRNERPPYNEYDVADRLKESGWTVPAYPLPPDCKDVLVMRAVVREDMSVAVVDHLLNDLHRAVEYLEEHFAAVSPQHKEEMVEKFHKHRKPDPHSKRSHKHNIVC